MRDEAKRMRELFVLLWPTKSNVARSAVVEDQKKKILEIEEKVRNRQEAEQK